MSRRLGHNVSPAIPEGTDPPTHLPTEFRCRVRVFNIIAVSTLRLQEEQFRQLIAFDADIQAPSQDIFIHCFLLSSDKQTFMDYRYVKRDVGLLVGGALEMLSLQLQLGYSYSYSEFPGCVYLLESYLLSEWTDNGNFNAMQCPRRYLRHLPISKAERHGSAFVTKQSGFDEIFLDHLTLQTRYTAYVVCHGHLKPLIGQHDIDTTAGQTLQLLIALSEMDVMWFKWHIVSAEAMNG